MISIRPRIPALPLVASAVLFLACNPVHASGQRVVTVERGAYTPSISPNGSTIAVGILGKIWLLALEGGEARQLSFGHGWDHHPVWSADAARLAYVHDTPASSEIVLHTFATGTSRTLSGSTPLSSTPFSSRRCSPTQSRKGTRRAFR